MKTPDIHRQRRHYPGLDGLRGVAILLVMTGHFTHLDPGGFASLPFESLRQMGWTGVDLFFVLSGFLITGNLLDLMQKTRNTRAVLKTFFLRRVLRIVPLYYFLLLLYTVIFPRILPADNPFIPKPWITDPAWYWTFLANIYMYLRGSFPNEVMSVAWSLALEEQFYLFWPFALIWLRSSLFWTCTLIVAIAITTRIFLFVDGANSMQIFVHPAARVDALAIGALFCYITRTPTALDGMRRYFGFVITSALAIVFSCYLWDIMQIYGHIAGIETVFIGTNATPQSPLNTSAPQITAVFLYTGLALLYGCLVFRIWDWYSQCGSNPEATSRASRSNNPWWLRILETKFLRLAGLYSYAMYLLNDTINHTLETFGLAPRGMLASLPGGELVGQIVFYCMCYPLTFAAGWLCYHLIEKHFLKLKNHPALDLPS